ncbi:isochorismatase [Paenibacillus sp. 79R4]|uniref:isochorismatase family protein n=1 Tax=Paenibacillus sp. 79R4 TaxID=2212847 RepID=UPI0015B7E2FA|nr:isochorismatase family protein [Paenibacillus sp. 79R4]NWL88401.1 isochorismatase [Paenibacillus sp. 79R4]
MKIGFLVIDMQTIHLQGIDKQVIDKASEYINYVSDMFRSKDQVVIHIQDIEGITESSREAFSIIPEIHVMETDLILTKEYTNGFWKTELEQMLKEQGVDFLIISGNAAEYCVLSTYNGAIERGFSTVILQNGILSTHNDVITSTYRDRNIISYPAIKYLLNK